MNGLLQGEDSGGGLNWRASFIHLDKTILLFGVLMPLQGGGHAWHVLD